MSMSALEATVEIVKTAIQHGTSNTYLIIDNEQRTEFLEGIEEIYKKLKELEKEGKKISAVNLQ